MQYYYVESKCFDGTYRPEVWYTESKPISNFGAGKRIDVQNVHQIDEAKAKWPIASLHEIFNPKEATNDGQEQSD